MVIILIKFKKLKLKNEVNFSLKAFFLESIQATKVHENAIIEKQL